MDKAKLKTTKTSVKRSMMLSSKATCVECSNPFKISLEEFSRFKDKRIPLPTRCKACRRYKLIEIKLKKITKLLFMILDGKKKKRYEPKLQTKQSQRKPTQEKS